MYQWILLFNILLCEKTSTSNTLSDFHITVDDLWPTCLYDLVKRLCISPLRFIFIHLCTVLLKIHQRFELGWGLNFDQANATLWLVFFFNDFVVNVLAELADHCLLMFDSKNAKKAKSLPLHHRAWQMVSCVCAKMQCLGFTKHGSAHYVQTSFLFQSLFSGLFRSNSLKLRRAIMVILYRRGFLHFQTSHACSVLFQLHCYEV